MSVSTLALASFVIAIVALLLGVLGWVVGLIAGVANGKNQQLQGNSVSVKVATRCVVGSGICFGIALIVIFVAGLWWLFDFYLIELTPGTLAMYCLVLGFAPFSVTVFSIIIAKVLGGTVDASGARNCTLLSIDLGPIIYPLFMTYRLALLTSGLAALGLMGSAIWMIVRLF